MVTTGRPLNIVCVSHSDTGHMNPILLLAEGLVRRGHRVRVVTFAFAEGKFRQRMAAIGTAAQFVGLPSDHTEESLNALVASQKCMPFALVADLMRPHLASTLTTALEGRKVDVVVADFMAFAAHELAEQWGVPLVINWPGPLEMLKGFTRALDLFPPVTLGGVAVSWLPFKKKYMGFVLNVGQLRTVMRMGSRRIANSLVLVNSFWGLEPPIPLPPSIKMVGPLGDPDATNLSRSHPELAQFLDASSAVVYVSTGSMVVPQGWLVRVLYDALKLVGCSVVWSLKAESQVHLPRSDDPAFFIRAWLPQLGILAHPNLAAVVTHCGWGGCLECIQGGKPVVTLPFFGDQPDNAAVLWSAGGAVALARDPALHFQATGEAAYRPGDITPEGAAAAIRRAITDPRLAEAARRLRALSRGPGLGCDSACQHIEEAALHGLAHLVDPRRYRRMCDKTPALVTLLLGGLAAAAAAWVLPWMYASTLWMRRATKKLGA